MLGKRPRAMQRSTSKMQLLPTDNPSSPLAFPSKHKPSLDPPAPPRQVIGFNPVLTDLHVAVPRPSPVALTEIRSPRSGLESLLSSPPASQKKAGALEIISKDLDVVEISIVKDEEPSLKQSEPIHIGRNDSPPERRHSHELSFHCLSSLSFRSYNNPVDVMEMELAHESIFSTASPASLCSDSCLLIDFLNSCFFCKRQLGHGKDIYMYRGDRAFCSMECRFQQIALDERKDRCSTSVPSSMIKLRSRLHIASPAAAA